MSRGKGRRAEEPRAMARSIIGHVSFCYGVARREKYMHGQCFLDIPGNSYNGYSLPPK